MQIRTREGDVLIRRVDNGWVLTVISDDDTDQSVHEDNIDDLDDVEIGHRNLVCEANSLKFCLLTAFDDRVSSKRNGGLRISVEGPQE